MIRGNTTGIPVLIALVLLPGFLLSCQPTPGVIKPRSEIIDTPAPRLVPGQGKILLIIGQDLTSISDYAGSGIFPVPGAVTTYLAFYNLLGAGFPAYGALGQDASGEPLVYDVDWGAGRLNANSAAFGYPGSALAIGLSIAEGNGRLYWARGGMARIGRGEHDDEIRRLARFIKQVDKSVYLRVGYEFDGAWNSGYENRQNYIDAFRRIVDVIDSENIDNVAYVWQAGASPLDDLIDGYRENIEDWYPGDNYVDFVGLSWFLASDKSRDGAASQRELADEVLDFARSRHKPVMIAESAPQGYDLENLTRSQISPLWDGVAGASVRSLTADEIWQAWFEPFFRYIEINRDVIRAVAYINANWNSQPKWAFPYREGYWGDSRLQANSLIHRRWLDRVGNPSRWLHGGPELDEQLSR